MKDRSILSRTLKVGETLTFDDGRIKINLLERTGRNACRIRLDLAPEIVVNKPSDAAREAAAIDSLQKVC